jgi:hypothetical protein
MNVVKIDTFANILRFFIKVVKINTEEVYIVNAKCSGAATILVSIG